MPDFQAAQKAFARLLTIMNELREGCPWDREQGAKEFAHFAREECQELLDAFASEDNNHIEEEFGDVLFCLLATAAAAEEEGRFTLENALTRIHEKMIRRHDHVFGDDKAASPEEAIERWNQVKQAEKEMKSQDTPDE